MSYTLIDTPVTPFHPVADIEAWLADLRAMPESPERDDAIEEAEDWLTFARELADAR
jgi:hypothetical protein